MIEDGFYDRVGGHAAFVTLVDAFYERVAVDPVMRPMYPEDSLEGAKWRLTAFLEQYWGGPTTYSDERGHPRLRMRHNPFPVTFDARDRWLRYMTEALDSLTLSPMDYATMLDYFERAAAAMVNTGDDTSDTRTRLM